MGVLKPLKTDDELRAAGLVVVFQYGDQIGGGVIEGITKISVKIRGIYFPRGSCTFYKADEYGGP